jgi:serine/threonine protein kinase
LGKLLGAGKFGEVFVGQHKKTGFISAIKIISKKQID